MTLYDLDGHFSYLKPFHIKHRITI